MIVLPEIGIQLHVFAEIMHPPHIPLEAEAKAFLLNLARDLGPCG